MYARACLLLSLLLVGCQDSRNPAQVGPPPFVGTWAGQAVFVPISFTFNPDGSYTAGGAGLVTQGKWTQDGETILLHPDKPAAASVERGAADRAKWAVSDDGKTLTLNMAKGQTSLAVYVLQRQAAR